MAGWWLKIEDAKAFEVHDHAGDFYEGPALAKKMGNVATFQVLHEQELKPEGRTGKNRDAIVMAVMEDGFIRVREHGPSVTFEFTQRPHAALDAIYLFGAKNLGPMSDMLVVQINQSGGTVDSANLKWPAFKELYAEDTAKILRTAKKEVKT